jgi:hypothetical protein
MKFKITRKVVESTSKEEGIPSISENIIGAYYSLLSVFFYSFAGRHVFIMGTRTINTALTNLILKLLS